MESLKKKKERASQIQKILRTTYPDARCELDHKSPIELLVATILSAQCTDKQVNIVTEKLFKKYRSLEDYATAPLEELQEDVRPTGFFRNKAKNIQGACQTILDKFGGRFPDTMEALTQLSGVGRKTANVILGTAFGKNEGVVVDTHVMRLSGLLDLSQKASPEKIEQDLMKLIPQGDWSIFSHLLVWHGRRRCKARKPDCLNCEISALCPARSQRLKSFL
ncbi:MAG TPA: endonuclease III [Verrucomicrobiota bacterium]|jgi:endonuclease-3|nr:endonuclease III [Verrucomicrobiota bacterium]